MLAAPPVLPALEVRAKDLALALQRRFSRRVHGHCKSRLEFSVLLIRGVTKTEKQSRSLVVALCRLVDGCLWAFRVEYKRCGCLEVGRVLCGQLNPGARLACGSLYRRRDALGPPAPPFPAFRR